MNPIGSNGFIYRKRAKESHCEARIYNSRYGAQLSYRANQHSASCYGFNSAASK
ncbi:MAG: hypothetical protein JMDDDDMK_05445 [Acidobacteria bacterium]|nr:hypothetical protein [Acidobacteriota bacterium]